MPERPNGAVSKTVVSRERHRGFKSHSLRSLDLTKAPLGIARDAVNDMPDRRTRAAATHTDVSLGVHHGHSVEVLSGYDIVLDSRGGENLEKSLTVLKPGGQAIGVTGPPDPGFAKQLGAPKFMGVVMGLLSRKVRKQARKLGVSYSFLFVQANGRQLRELASLYDAGHLRPLIDKTFPFDQTIEALAYVEQGRANGKVVSTFD